MVSKVTFFLELRLGIYENICNYRKFSGLRIPILGAFLPQMAQEKQSIGPKSLVADHNSRLNDSWFLVPRPIMPENGSSTSRVLEYLCVCCS
jgi:hypothetical protein